MNHQEVSKTKQIYQDKEIFCLKEEAESKVSIEQGPNSPPENSKLYSFRHGNITHIQCFSVSPHSSKQKDRKSDYPHHKIW